MKERFPTAVLGVGMVFTAATPVFAHHTFAGTYFPGQTIKIEGDLVQFLYRNPHSFVHLNVSDSATGTVTRYAVEWAAGGQLGRSGVSRDTLKPGDHVIIVGHPARKSEDHMLRMISITRPSDGWNWGGTFD